jgi:hypothetical protein
VIEEPKGVKRSDAKLLLPRGPSAATESRSHETRGPMRSRDSITTVRFNGSLAERSEMIMLKDPEA